MSFKIDPKLVADGAVLLDWPLSTVILRNDKVFPWLTLVPRLPNMRELYELAQQQQYQLMDEISRASAALSQHSNADKINVGTLGNRVSQLHVHIVARFRDDPLWPAGVWQQNYQQQPFELEAFEQQCYKLKTLLS